MSRAIEQVRISAVRCANVFSQSPCTATAPQGAECYNTRASCQDVPNFNATEHEIVFVRKDNPDFVANAYNCITRNDAVSETLTPEGLGLSGSVVIDLEDSAGADGKQDDPYIITRARAMGTRLGRLFARQRFLAGREAVVEYADGSTQVFTVRTIAAGLRGTYRLELIDPLSDIISRDVGVSPVFSLVSAIDESATTASVATPLTETIAVGDLLAIGGAEVVGVSSASSVDGTDDRTWTLGIVRAQFSTDAAQASAGEKVSRPLLWDSVDAAQIISDILDDAFGGDLSAVYPFDFYEPNQTLTGGIIEPTAAREVLQSVLTAIGAHLFFDSYRGRVVLDKVDAWQTLAANFTDDEIIIDTFSRRTRNELLATRVRAEYNFAPPWSANSRSAVSFVFSEYEAEELWGRPYAADIAVRWNNSGDVELAATAAREKVQRYITLADELSFAVSASALGDVRLGSVVQITSERGRQGMDGRPVAIRAQVVAIEWIAIDAVQLRALRWEAIPEADLPDLIFETDTANVDIFEIAGSPAGAVNLRLVVRAGVVISGVRQSSKASAAAMFFIGFHPESTFQLVLESGALIIGAGGIGGAGDNPGNNGGDAIVIDGGQIGIDNGGTIAGGGGGGGGGLSFSSPTNEAEPIILGVGGSGGGGGQGTAAIGGVAAGLPAGAEEGRGGIDGSGSSPANFGAGGAGAVYTRGSLTIYGGRGGRGGSFGEDGERGYSGRRESDAEQHSGEFGGTAGKAFRLLDGAPSPQYETAGDIRGGIEQGEQAQPPENPDAPNDDNTEPEEPPVDTPNLEAVDVYAGALEGDGSLLTIKSGALGATLPLALRNSYYQTATDFIDISEPSYVASGSVEFSATPLTPIIRTGADALAVLVGFRYPSAWHQHLTNTEEVLRFGTSGADDGAFYLEATGGRSHEGHQYALYRGDESEPIAEWGRAMPLGVDALDYFALYFAQNGGDVDVLVYAGGAQVASETVSDWSMKPATDNAYNLMRFGSAGLWQTRIQRVGLVNEVLTAGDLAALTATSLTAAQLAATATNYYAALLTGNENIAASSGGTFADITAAPSLNAPAAYLEATGGGVVNTAGNPTFFSGKGYARAAVSTAETVAANIDSRWFIQSCQLLFSGIESPYAFGLIMGFQPLNGDGGWEVFVKNNGDLKVSDVSNLEEGFATIGKGWHSVAWAVDVETDSIIVAVDGAIIYETPAGVSDEIGDYGGSTARISWGGENLIGVDSTIRQLVLMLENADDALDIAGARAIAKWLSKTERKTAADFE